MSYQHAQKSSFLAADLIEEQLGVLALAIPAVVQACESGGVATRDLARIVGRRKLRLVKTASGGNIVAEKAEHPDKAPEAGIPSIPAIQRKNDHLRVLTGNCLVTVGAFLRQHNMLDMRTPEIQFLGHAVNAVLNDNILKVDAGYMPTAAFDGLVINPGANGKPLFDVVDSEGLMTVGDALALLHWLSRYFRGEGGYVSGGDAG